MTRKNEVCFCTGECEKADKLTDFLDIAENLTEKLKMQLEEIDNYLKQRSLGENE